MNSEISHICSRTLEVEMEGKRKKTDNIIINKNVDFDSECNHLDKNKRMQ